MWREKCTCFSFFFLLNASVRASPEGEWKMLKGEGLPRRVDSFLSLSLVVRGSRHAQSPPVQLGSDTWRVMPIPGLAGMRLMSFVAACTVPTSRFVAKTVSITC